MTTLCLAPQLSLHLPAHTPPPSLINQTSFLPTTSPPHPYLPAHSPISTPPSTRLAKRKMTNLHSVHTSHTSPSDRAPNLCVYQPGLPHLEVAQGLDSPCVMLPPTPLVSRCALLGTMIIQTCKVADTNHDGTVHLTGPMASLHGNVVRNTQALGDVPAHSYNSLLSPLPGSGLVLSSAKGIVIVESLLLPELDVNKSSLAQGKMNRSCPAGWASVYWALEAETQLQPLPSTIATIPPMPPLAVTLHYHHIILHQSISNSQDQCLPPFPTAHAQIDFDLLTVESAKAHLCFPFNVGEPPPLPHGPLKFAHHTPDRPYHSPRVPHLSNAFTALVLILGLLLFCHHFELPSCPPLHLDSTLLHLPFHPSTPQAPPLPYQTPHYRPPPHPPPHLTVPPSSDQVTTPHPSTLSPPQTRYPQSIRLPPCYMPLCHVTASDLQRIESPHYNNTTPLGCARQTHLWLDSLVSCHFRTPECFPLAPQFWRWSLCPMLVHVGRPSHHSYPKLLQPLSECCSTARGRSENEIGNKPTPPCSPHPRVAGLKPIMTRAEHQLSATRLIYNYKGIKTLVDDDPPEMLCYAQQQHTPGYYCNTYRRSRLLAAVCRLPLRPLSSASC